MVSNVVSSMITSIPRMKERCLNITFAGGIREQGQEIQPRMNTYKISIEDKGRNYQCLISKRDKYLLWQQAIGKGWKHYIWPKYKQDYLC